MSFQQGDFVDRHEPLAAIREMVKHQKPRILYLLAPPGYGKSYLLKEFREQCRSENTAHVWLDFGETSSDYSYREITQRISAELGPTDFEFFDETADDTKRLMKLFGEALTPVKVENSGSRGTVIQEFHNSVAEMVAAGDIIQIGEIKFGDITLNMGEGSAKSLEAAFTAALQVCLKTAAAKHPIIFFIDHWEKASSESQRWLQNYLLDWLVENELSHAVALIGAYNAPSLPPQKTYNAQIERLGPLSEDFVREYWVDRRGFDPRHVEEVHRASEGRPAVLKLLADCWETQPSAQFWGEPTVSCVLDSLPPQQSHLAQVVRVGAIPHWIDGSLLTEMMGRMEIGGFKNGLAEFLSGRHWADEDPQVPGRFRYNDQVREILLDYWREDCPSEYSDLNRRLVSYFEAQTKKVSPSQQAIYEREMVYHQMLLDEQQGLRLIRTLFEDAYRHYDLARMEGLVCKYREEMGRVRPDTERWLGYYSARVDGYYRRDSAEEALRTLCNDPDLLLRGLVRWSLGDLLAARGEWAQAIELYQESLKILRLQSHPEYTARVMMSLGDAYRGIADQNGRIPEDGSELFGLRSSVLTRLEAAPASAYRWLLHKLPLALLPPQYAGLNYQEWILASLRETASAKYHDAVKIYPAVQSDGQGISQARLRIAEMQHQLGCWSRAQAGYTSLLQQGAGGNAYGVAQIWLGQARAALSEGNWDEAQRTLSDVLKDFEQYSDLNSAATVAEMLAQCCLRLNRPSDAVPHLLKSAQLFELIGASLEHTEVTWQIEDAASLPLAEPDKQRIVEYVEPLRERHYLIRFGDELQGRFARMVPLTYLLAVGVSLGLLLPLMVVESDWAMFNQPLSTSDAIWHILLAALPLPLSLWAYRIIYTLLGVGLANGEVRRLKLIERAPRRIITDADGIRYYASYTRGAAPSQLMRWTEVKTFVKAITKQNHQPVDFLSRLLLEDASGKPLVIEGVTTGFARLIQDVEKHLSKARTDVRRQNHPLTIFDRYWLIGIVAGCLIYSLILHFANVLKLSVQLIDNPAISARLPLSEVMIGFLPTLLFVLPAVTLWRLSLFQTQLPAPLRQPLYRRHAWLFWAAAVLSTLVALTWIIGIPLLFLSSS